MSVQLGRAPAPKPARRADSRFPDTLQLATYVLTDEVELADLGCFTGIACYENVEGVSTELLLAIHTTHVTSGLDLARVQMEIDPNAYFDAGRGLVVWRLEAPGRRPLNHGQAMRFFANYVRWLAPDGRPRPIDPIVS